MAIRTSSQNGNWNLTSTWGGAAVPGNGDQAIINHQVSVTDSRIVGTSPAEDSNEYAIEVNANDGKLTVETSGFLQVRGPVLMNGLLGGGGDIELQDGSIWEFDSSQATDPTNQNYPCIVGDSSVELNAKFIVLGTTNNRVVVRSNASGGNGYFTSTGFFNGGNHNWSYARLQRIGTSSIPAFTMSTLSTANVTFIFDNCILENCGSIFSTSIQQEVSIAITNNRWIGSVGSFTLDLSVGGGFAVTGSRVFSGNSFDIAPKIPVVNATINDNFFADAWHYVQAAGRASSVNNNFIRQTSSHSDQVRSGNWNGNYNCVDGSTLDLANKNYSATADFNNPHWNTPLGTDEGTYRVENCIFEDFGSNGEGDINYGDNTTGYHSIFEYNIILPSQSTSDGAPLNAGTLGTINGWNGLNSQYNHNTFYNGGQGMLALAEAGDGFSNMVTSAKSNIVWNDDHYSASSFNYFAYYPTSPANAVHDQISVGGATNNCMFNIRSDGSNLGSGNTNGHYNIRGTTSYGTNDIYGDPGFFDPTRNFTTWVEQLLNGVHPLTVSPTRYDWNSYGLYLLSLFNDTTHADYNAEATFDNLKTYIREGFAPTNISLANAGHDNVTIGAVEMFSSEDESPNDIIHKIISEDDITIGNNIVSISGKTTQKLLNRFVATQLTLEQISNKYNNRLDDTDYYDQ